MIPAANYKEVLNPVVPLLAVDVVYHFVGRQWPAKMVLHYPSVLLNLMTGNLHAAVSLWFSFVVRRSSAIVRAVLPKVRVCGLHVKVLLAYFTYPVANNKPA